MSMSIVGPSLPRTDVVPDLAVRTTDQTSGAMGVKEHGTSGRAGLCPSRPAITKNRMTLGNGYLGPRIDEERSEMRYVV